MAKDSQITASEHEEIRWRSQQRDRESAYRRMLDQDKAATLREQERALLATNLYGQPVDPEIRSAAREIVKRRWSLRMGSMQW